MELWKIHKYCESAALGDLEEKERRLSELWESGKLQETNAFKALVIIREYIELKRLFEN